MHSGKILLASTVFWLSECTKPETPDNAGPEHGARGAVSEVGPSYQTFEGRCSGSAILEGGMHFYPSMSEMFVDHLGESMIRIPISVSEEEYGHIRFSYNWGLIDQPASSHTATFRRVDAQTWAFESETVKGVCNMVPNSRFITKVADLGITPGKYDNWNDGEKLTVADDSQKFLFEQPGKVHMVNYRVKSHAEDGTIKLYVSADAPSADRTQLWGVWTINKLGEDIVVRDAGGRVRKFSPLSR